MLPFFFASTPASVIWDICEHQFFWCERPNRTHLILFMSVLYMYLFDPHSEKQWIDMITAMLFKFHGFLNKFQVFARLFYTVLARNELILLLNHNFSQFIPGQEIIWIFPLIAQTIGPLPCGSNMIPSIIVFKTNPFSCWKCTRVTKHHVTHEWQLSPAPVWHSYRNSIARLLLHRLCHWYPFTLK